VQYYFQAIKAIKYAKSVGASVLLTRQYGAEMTKCFDLIFQAIAFRIKIITPLELVIMTRGSGLLI
jgi:hypothetical protein